MANQPSATFSDISGSVEDIFAGIGATTQANLKAQGLDISAYGNLIKAQGDIAEGQEYDLSAQLARQNEQYTVESTAIQQMQLDRNIASTIGGQQAGTAGGGLAASGSALDLAADSAAQGALAKTVLAEQGQITEAGYAEQAASYDVMSAAAKQAAAGETYISQQTTQLGYATQAAARTQATGDFIGAALKGVAAVATLGAG
jgi:hypothetical protein